MRLHTLGGLRIESDPPLPPLGRRRMGLLAIVAAAGSKGVSRDQVLGLLWPESTDDHARHTLAQNLYTLRRQTGRELIVATPELRLGPEITSDIAEFRAALARDDLSAATALYTGDFLEGFYLTDAPAFERWVEEERARIRAAALRALEALSTRADAGEEAIRHWRRLGELDPLSARYTAGTMRALAALGDRPAALAHARAYEELVRRELESDPDPSIRELAASLRRAVADEHHESVPVPSGAGSRTPPAAARAHPGSALRDLSRPRRLAAAAAAIALAGVVLVVGVRSFRGGSADAPVLAMGMIRVIDAPDSAALGPVMRDLLATSLASVPGLPVIANSRLVELSGPQARLEDLVPLDAARRAGAQEVVEGELTFGAAGMTLSLRRVAVSSGIVRGAYVVRAADRFAIVDSAATTLARDVGLEAPAAPSASRTPSTAAWALYEEGLRAWYGGDLSATWRLMSAALNRDSTFAMAAYYAWLAAQGTQDEPNRDLARARARRLASRTVDRERLLIEGSVAEFDAPIATTLAIAETLTVRYPDDPDGHLLLGRARHAAGDFAGASVAFARVIAMDSATGLAAPPHCHLCRALLEATRNYLWWDSAVAAERMARRLIVLDPDAHSGWSLLVEPLLRQGKRAQAEAALARAEQLGGVTAQPAFYLHRDLIRRGRHDELERELAVAILSASPAASGEARWVWLFSLRDQGRLAEAMALARDGIVPGTSARPAAAPDVAHFAFLPFEMGRPLDAAARFREFAAAERRSGRSPGRKARNVAWDLTLAATALAAAGDTAGVRALADSVERYGATSSFGRDPRLHHFLHGLLWQARGRHEEAVQAFRRSLFSTTDGYTRINLMMARSLLALDRAPEAVAILQPVLRGGIDGANTYLTRTEVHELLGDAFAAAGLADSARAHYRAVEHAWRDADPIFRTRWQRARDLARAN